MQKNAMFNIQNCDLWRVFKKYQNFEFFHKNSKTIHRTKKNPTNKKSYNYLLNLCTNFQSPRCNTHFFQNRPGHLNLKIAKTITKKVNQFTKWNITNCTIFLSYSSFLCSCQIFVHLSALCPQHLTKRGVVRSSYFLPVKF